MHYMQVCNKSMRLYTLFGKMATMLVMRTILPCLGGHVKYLFPFIRPSVFPTTFEKAINKIGYM